MSPEYCRIVEGHTGTEILKSTLNLQTMKVLDCLLFEQLRVWTLRGYLANYKLRAEISFATDVG